MGGTHTGNWPRLEIRPAELCEPAHADAPEPVKDKLLRWGVADYVSIFSRAVGINTVFSHPPDVDVLADEFLRNYHRYADFLYRCYMDSQSHQSLLAANFRFDPGRIG